MHELAPKSHVEESAERHWLIIRNTPQQAAKVAVRDLFEQAFGLGDEGTSAGIPVRQEGCAAIADSSRVIHNLLQNDLKIRVDRCILGERVDRVQSKLDRLAWMHLRGDQRKDDRLIHLVASRDRLLARRSLAMVANSNRGAMRALAICILGFQSEGRDLPRHVCVIARLSQGSCRRPAQSRRPEQPTCLPTAESYAGIPWR